MAARVDAAKAAGDILGGVFEVVAHGLPPGLGPMSTGTEVDALPGRRPTSIQAIKGVEVGDGFATAARPGVEGPRRVAPGARPGT